MMMYHQRFAINYVNSIDRYVVTDRDTNRVAFQSPDWNDCVMYIDLASADNGLQVAA